MDSTLPAVLMRLRCHVDTVYHSVLAAPHNGPATLRPLLPLLRSLSGKLHSTSLLAEELAATSPCHDKPQADQAEGRRAHLAACDSALHGLSRLIDLTLGTVDIDSFTSSMAEAFLSLQVRLDLASQATSLPALERCFSTTPSFCLSASTANQLGPSQPDPIHGPQTYQQSLHDFTRALETLLDPQYSTRISSYDEYRASAKTKTDDFRKSAVAWPGYAEEFWPQCKHLIIQLFHPRKLPNFEHWIMEYCRQTWPEVYGDRALNHAHTLQLLSIVTDSPFSPLHAAAALGLAQLCDHLIDLNADPGQYSPIGTPLYCSFIGPKAFLASTENMNLLAQLPCSSTAQAETIDLFTRRTIPRCVSETAASPGLGELLPLSTLAFHTCLRLRAHEPFLRMAPYLDLGENFWDVVVTHLLKPLSWENYTSESLRPFLNPLFTCLFDSHVARY
ncbi:hypothetical protein ACRALDRAFT_1091129, partial [Sodiomyces alcalophilus JCM 7366]|uniref:uncharacterized protein n=1 Tax=Sodiomyces alcalophilus JCM 7366 TaxID=591952 RepID=UPI0039B3AECC